MQWLEDLSVRLLTLMILDRFADYVSDEVSAGEGLENTQDVPLFRSNTRYFLETLLSNTVMVRFEFVALIDFTRFETITKFVRF